jgi:hypothetical protein
VLVGTRSAEDLESAFAKINESGVEAVLVLRAALHIRLVRRSRLAFGSHFRCALLLKKRRFLEGW